MCFQAVFDLDGTLLYTLAARAAGMFAVGACWGLRGPEELRRDGAQALVRHPGEVLELF